MSEDLIENYKRAFGRSVGFGERPALVLVDFAKAYFDPACELYAGVESAFASALRIREAARAAGVPIVLTEVVYQDGGINGGRFYEKSKPLHNFIKGRKAAEFADGLTPYPDEIVVSKQYPSAFFGTSLASTLTAGGIDSVILTGLSTSGCVRASCVDAMSYGFRTIVVADACGDRHPAPHEANLFDMNAKYADVVHEGDVMTYLTALGHKRAAAGT